jgi:hypothetical protein
VSPIQGVDDGVDQEDAGHAKPRDGLIEFQHGRDHFPIGPACSKRLMT